MKDNRDDCWVPVDHVCRNCGARVMRKEPRGLSVGEVYKCHTCGQTGFTVEKICWCGQQFRNSRPSSRNYICLPTNIREKYPEVRELFESAFRACGVDPDRVEVGIILFRDYNLIMREAEARRAVAEGGLKAVSGHERALKDVEKALQMEKKYLETPLATGLYLEKVWQEYLTQGESHLFVRALIAKVLSMLSVGNCFSSGEENGTETQEKSI